MYGWGVLCAVLAGAAANLGQLLNKLEVKRDGLTQAGGGAGSTGFYARLLRRPLWVTGVVLQVGAATVFFLLAQAYIGPALVPGLMASGLLVLVLGSAWIVRETPRLRELAGMACVAGSAAALGLSGLRIDLGAYEVLAPAFLLRAALFSLAACLLLFPALAVKRRSSGPRQGTLLALASGLLYVLSNFWVGPFMAAALRLLAAPRGAREPLAALGVLFAFSSAVLVLTNLFGIALMQRAFQRCSAASAVPLQMIPTQVAPAAVYLLVFRLPAPAPHSLPLFAAGVSLVMGGSFLLAGRRALRA